MVIFTDKKNQRNTKNPRKQHEQFDLPTISQIHTKDAVHEI